jgi:hypothetical protein
MSATASDRSEIIHLVVVDIMIIAIGCIISHFIRKDDIASYILKFLLLGLYNLLVLNILILLFPYTGLQRIVVIPIILVVQTAFILLGLRISKSVTGIPKMFLWTVVVLLNLFIALLSWPQDDNSSVINQLIDWII